MFLNVPVSAGEVVDKITILRIKNEKIADFRKKAHVQQELEKLEAICKQAGIDLRDTHTVELQTINQRLWDIEDQIREKERDRIFDASFIELARMVYITNDQRFGVKDQINQKYNSTIREQKDYKPY